MALAPTEVAKALATSLAPKGAREEGKRHTDAVSHNESDITCENGNPSVTAEHFCLEMIGKQRAFRE